MECLKFNGFTKQQQQQSGNEAITVKKCPPPVRHLQQNPRSTPVESAPLQWTSKCSKELPVNVNMRKLCATPPQQTAAAAHAQPTTRSTRQKFLKQKQKLNKIICDAPLELLVVGHQVKMRPVHMPTLAETSTAKSTATAAARYVSKQRPLRATAQADKQSPGGAKQMPMGNTEFVYIFESYPLELWPTNFDMAVKPNKLPPKMSNRLPSPQVAQQVIDARFLAELLDELLIR